MEFNKLISKEINKTNVDEKCQRKNICCRSIKKLLVRYNFIRKIKSINKRNITKEYDKLLIKFKSF